MVHVSNHHNVPKINLPIVDSFISVRSPSIVDIEYDLFPCLPSKMVPTLNRPEFKFSTQSIMMQVVSVPLVYLCSQSHTLEYMSDSLSNGSALVSYYGIEVE